MSQQTPEPGGAIRTVDQREFDEDVFLRVLRDAVDALEKADVPHVLMGGLAVSCLARPRWTHDIDLFVRPDDATRALQTLAEGGFATETTDPLWLFKATRDDVPVDIIFKSQGGVYLDDEMLARAVPATFKGERVRVLPPEDLVVIKAAAHSEDTGYHWFDALAVVASQALDWHYLMRRARRAVRRVLSFLVYAQSADVAVPDWVVRDVFDAVYAERPPDGRLDATAHPTPQPVGDLASLRDRLRADPRVGDIDIDVATHGSTVILEGEVATDSRRDLLGRVAADLMPGYDVDNRTTVRRLAEDVHVEKLR